MTSRVKLLLALLAVTLLGAFVYLFLLPKQIEAPSVSEGKTTQSEIPQSTSEAKGAVTTYSDVEFTYVMEEVIPGSDLGTYPKITSHTNSETLKRVNALLEEDKAMLGCGVRDLTDDEFKTELVRNDIAVPSNFDTLTYTQRMELLQYGSYARTEILYAKKGVLSIRTTIEYVCGGPYPVNALVYKTYDVASGTRAELPAVFRNFTKNQDVLIGLFNKYYASEAQGGECGSTLPDEAYLYAEFFVSDKGFFISPSLPHVSQACGGDIHIPIEEIKPYLAQNSILFRL